VTLEGGGPPLSKNGDEITDIITKNVESQVINLYFCISYIDEKSVEDLSKNMKIVLIAYRLFKK